MNLPAELVNLIQEKLWLLPQPFSEYEQPFLQDYFVQKLLVGASPAVIRHFSSINNVELDLNTLVERPKFTLEQGKSAVSIGIQGILQL